MLRSILFDKVLEDDMILISLSAKGIGDTGMLGFGLGGLTMSDAKVQIIVCSPCWWPRPIRSVLYLPNGVDCAGAGN